MAKVDVRWTDAQISSLRYHVSDYTTMATSASSAG